MSPQGIANLPNRTFDISPSTYPSICSSIHPFLYSYTYPSIHPSTNSSIHPSIPPSIHLSIHPRRVILLHVSVPPDVWPIPFWPLPCPHPTCPRSQGVSVILDPVINSGNRTDRTVSESFTVSFTNYSVATALGLHHNDWWQSLLQLWRNFQ